MTEAFSRTERLLGKENMDRLAKAKVLSIGFFFIVFLPYPYSNGEYKEFKR